MIAVYEGYMNASRKLIVEFETFAEAEAYSHATFNIVHFAVDEEYFDSADFITKYGSTYCIQPTTGLIKKEF